MKTPVLFIIFNRPNTTRKVFSAIRKARPPYLLIAADGPRKDSSVDRDLCFKTRKITERIDWDCKVKRLYRKSNLGAGKGSAEAISWFFKNVDRGIILEDDCLPAKSFFKFCEEMLEKFENNEEVMAISGDNFMPKRNWNSNGFIFSKYFSPPWGWATWKQKWVKFDRSLKNWSKVRNENGLVKYFSNFWERMYWEVIFDFIYKYRPDDIWDYQWQYSIWSKKGLVVTPGVNLVKNIGLKNSYTHISLNYGNLNITKGRIASNPTNLGNLQRKKQEKYMFEKIYRISPKMVLGQWFYYNLRMFKFFNYVGNQILKL